MTFVDDMNMHNYYEMVFVVSTDIVTFPRSTEVIQGRSRLMTPDDVTRFFFSFADLMYVHTYIQLLEEYACCQFRLIIVLRSPSDVIKSRVTWA